MIAMVLLLVIFMLVLGTLAYLDIKGRLELIQEDVSKVRLRMPVPLPAAGGRTAPTPDQLQAARNRMDVTGLAHPGRAE